MTRDLKETMVEAAAAQYGRVHYRGILFWTSVGRYWWLLVLPTMVVGLWWAATHLTAPSNAGIGFGVAALAVIGLLYLGIRHLRSPYRRRRFWL